MRSCGRCTPRLVFLSLLLWGLPPLALAIGLAALIVMARRRKSVPAAVEALSPEEQAKLVTLVGSAGTER